MHVPIIARSQSPDSLPRLARSWARRLANLGKYLQQKLQRHAKTEEGYYRRSLYRFVGVQLMTDW